MRAKIGEHLEERIQRVYQLAGYGRKGDLIRKATREHLDELEAKYITREQSVRDAFSHTIDRGGVGGPEIRLIPNPESPMRFEYVHVGDPPHTTILDTGITFVPEKKPAGSNIPGLKDTLEDTESIERANVLTAGGITVRIAEDTPIPVVEAEEEEPLVNRIYDALGELIEEANRRIHEGEETRQDAKRLAVKDYE